MKIRRNMNIIYNIVRGVLIFWLIVCSGSQHFQIFHARATYLLLLIIALIVFSLKFKISKRVLQGTFLFIVAVAASVLFSRRSIENAAFDYDGIIKLGITLIAIMVIHSSMTSEKFKKYFIYSMLFEAVLSLICFTYITILQRERLPFQYEQLVQLGRNSYNIVYLTFYYTLGWLSTRGYFHRNAGMFWEPGAHQIFLNMALTFVFTGGIKNIEQKKRIIVAAILIVTVLTTKSTTGYMCLILNGVYAMFKEKTTRIRMSNKIILLFILVITVLGVAMYGDVFDKIIYGTGSFSTRKNDTIGGLKVAMRHFILGNGLFNDVSQLYSEVGILAMSNGFVGLLARGGILFFAVYCYMLIQGGKKIFNETGMNYCILMGILLLYLCTESICFHPVIISLLIPWAKKENVFYENFAN